MAQHDELVMRPIWLVMWKFASNINREMEAVKIIAASNRSSGARARDLLKLLDAENSANAAGLPSAVDALRVDIREARARLLETLESTEPKVGREVEREKEKEKGKSDG